MPFQVTLSGSACDTPDLTCSADSVCHVLPHAPGTCHIVVKVDGGATITKDIAVVPYYDRCCPGLQPQQSHIETPAQPEAGAD